MFFKHESFSFISLWCGVLHFTDFFMVVSSDLTILLIDLIKYIEILSFLFSK